MNPAVIFKQLDCYRSGKRLWGVMGAIAKALSTQDSADVAAYFAARPTGLTAIARRGRSTKANRKTAIPRGAWHSSFRPRRDPSDRRRSGRAIPVFRGGSARSQNPACEVPSSPARVVCGSQPVASTRAASVAPLSFVSIATMSASFEPARGEPAGGGFSAVAVAELGLALPVSTGGCVSPASSSMPIASRPARVMIRLMGRPIVVSSFSSVLSSLKFAWNHRTHFEFYMYL